MDAHDVVYPPLRALLDAIENAEVDKHAAYQCLMTLLVLHWGYETPFTDDDVEGWYTKAVAVLVGDTRRRMEATRAALESGGLTPELVSGLDMVNRWARKYPEVDREWRRFGMQHGAELRKLIAELEDGVGPESEPKGNQPPDD